MKKNKTLIVAVFAFFGILGSPQVGAQENHHIVTAWRDYWIYQGVYSDVGREAPVRISAAPGDIVEFRQSEGRHGVFFYETSLDDSDLGIRSSVDQLFEVVTSSHQKMSDTEPDEADEGDANDNEATDDHEATDEDDMPAHHAKRMPASSLAVLNTRIFPRFGRQTTIQSGRATIVRIKLSSHFDRPLYFGDLTRNGKTGFGVIVPVERGALSKRAANVSQTIDLRNKDSTGWTLKTLCLEANGFRYEFRSAVGEDSISQQWVKYSRSKDSDPSDAKLFDGANDSVNEWSPENLKWEYSICEDFNGDGSKDVLVMGKDKEEGTFRWSILKNNATPYKRLIWVVTGNRPEQEEKAFGFTSLLFGDDDSEAVYVGTPAEPLFSAPIDLNRDGFTDVVVLEKQNGVTVLQPYFNFPKPQNNDDDSSSQRLFKPLGETIELPGEISPPTYWTVTDNDFDGWPDLVVGNPTKNSGAPAVFLNNGELRGFREALFSVMAVRDDQADESADKLPKIESFQLLNLPTEELQSLEIKSDKFQKARLKFRKK